MCAQKQQSSCGAKWAVVVTGDACGWHALVLWKMVGPRQVSRLNSWRLQRLGAASPLSLVSRWPGSTGEGRGRPPGPFNFLDLGLTAWVSSLHTKQQNRRFVANVYKEF